MGITNKNFVHRYYHLNLTLDEICNQCHGSKFHLSRLFKQVTQQTIMQYLHQIRIQKVSHCLMRI